MYFQKTNIYESLQSKIHKNNKTDQIDFSKNNIA